ncbi:uncharacterized protein YjiS (DUF1127 family) [Ochrobactrum daejeonense]|uniref:Uncharacterized protein YjiS (DUF1127 family) n=1 Tax=Brucella daejeonensis TaxID=659015 RepID=A0A7W9EM31_9HYPH|nr:DUF1127 domain-containing protein [Brucella daejeonensis]MBB5701655.1 uncharacterized protein YjiS (DUF1127 family) [Brucella daejeonensis]
MTVQCHTLTQSASIGRTGIARNASALPDASAPSWFLDIWTRIRNQAELWSHERRIKRSRRVLEALPEHILHDIGWPNIDDRLARPTSGPTRKN